MSTYFWPGSKYDHSESTGNYQIQYLMKLKLGLFCTVNSLSSTNMDVKINKMQPQKFTWTLNGITKIHQTEFDSVKNEK